MEKKLYKSRDRKVAGVCGGIAQYFGIDPTVVRIVWLVISLCYGVGIVAYLICMFLMPDYPSNIIDAE